MIAILIGSLPGVLKFGPSVLYRLLMKSSVLAISGLVSSIVKTSPAKSIAYH